MIGHMKKNDFVMKQVHLDFHTSPNIENIGVNFSKENFQNSLKEANIESITVFAKCHHSMCYYPTEVGTMHPHLDFDLTGAMVDAAHEIGLRAPIYITAGWSHQDAIEHPEWRAVDKAGNDMIIGAFPPDATDETPKQHCCWHTLCLNDGPYAEHIYAITEEVCQRYSVVDGLFYDICTIGEACYCASCKKGMLEMGLNPENEEDAKNYFVMKRQAFMSKCGDIMRKYHPNATIFFNGTAHMKKPEYYEGNTHFEMENLPTAWGGYNQLPLRAKYFKGLGKSVIGMTGKFHLDWGEFGGFKCKEALKYEIATMATYGVGASIGDHMHPDGEMEMQTYENIGHAFRYLDEITPYCLGGEAVTDIGVYYSHIHNAHEGISDMLLENQLDYQLISGCDFGKCQVVIIPDDVVLEDEAVAALKNYIHSGGKLILMANALVKDGEFQLDFGVRYIGDSEYDCDYISLLEPNDTLPNAPMLCNIPGYRVENCDAEVYAEFLTPYFSRTYGHFCGHKNTPHDKNAKRYPAILKKGNVVYMSHSLPKQYAQFGSLYHKRYFMYALNLVYDRNFTVEGLGSQGRCTVLHQPDKNRYCINMLYAVPVKRGRAEIIEDLQPIYNINCSFEMREQVTRVYMPLADIDLEYQQNEGTLKFVVPKVECHEVVVIEVKK